MLMINNYNNNNDNDNDNNNIVKSVNIYNFVMGFC